MALREGKRFADRNKRRLLNLVRDVTSCIDSHIYASIYAKMHSRPLIVRLITNNSIHTQCLGNLAFNSGFNGNDFKRI